MPSLRSSSGCGPTSNSYPALSRLFVEHIDPCCNDCDLTIGDNNIVVNTKDNRVGINTSNPVEALDVDGNIYTSGDVSSKTASFYGDPTPGTTTLNVTGDSSFYGNVTSIGDITAATIESTGEAKLGSLKVLGVSNLDGNLNVPSGNIVCGGSTTSTGNISTSGTLTSAGNITTTGGGIYVSSTKLEVTYALNVTPTDGQTTSVVDIVNTNATSFTLHYLNLTPKLTGNSNLNIEVGYGTNTYITSNYSGVTWGYQTGTTHSTNINLVSTTVPQGKYITGSITFTKCPSTGGQKFYQYEGIGNDGDNNFTISGRVYYTSTLPNLNLIKFTMSNQFLGGSTTRYIQVRYTV